MYRYFLFLLIRFLFRIFGLIFSSDLLSLIVFWDLLGFTSFFLVIFYRTRSAISGSILTGLTNRVGDCFLFCYFCFYIFSGSTVLGGALFLLFIVSFTKSAQIPFSAWLPAAIVAPTPVSALVHSRTLVTAGVYLLYRYIPYYSPAVLYTGVLTTFFAGLAALVENDFKKIIALSTLSQLGIMVTSLGLEQRSLAFVHLNIHASFKALLFMAVGILIHNIYGSQGFRKLGTLFSSSSLVGTVFMVSSGSMCGLVFTSGWSSKEVILSSSFRTAAPLALVFMFYVGLILTISYCTRMISFARSVHSAHTTNTCTIALGFGLKAPLYLLTLLSLLHGILFSPLSGLSSVILSSWCSVVFFFSVLAGICLGYFHAPLFEGLQTPFDYLKHSTSYLGFSGVTFTNFLHLEAPRLLTFGVTKAPTALKLITAKAWFALSI